MLFLQGKKPFSAKLIETCEPAVKDSMVSEQKSIIIIAMTEREREMGEESEEDRFH